MQQPLEEGDGLVDLLVGVARGAGAGELDHPPRPVGHRREVLDRGADVGEDPAQRLLDPAQLLVGEPPLELEVHDRLAARGLARVQDGVDRAVGVALDPDDRVQHAVDAEAARPQLRAHRVDEERPVLGVGLHHRARQLVAVLLERRGERPDRDRLRAARGGELEGADDRAAEGVGVSPSTPPSADRRRRKASAKARTAGARSEEVRSPIRSSRDAPAVISRRIQALLQRVELRCHLGWQTVAELVEELADRGDLLLPRTRRRRRGCPRAPSRGCRARRC